MAFEWLQDRQWRHGGLATIQTAVARGWMNGLELASRRADLVEALGRIVDDPVAELNARELTQIMRIYEAMETANSSLARTPRKTRPARKRH
jgi:hypothetical protein